jgi:hypothetical protein
MFINVLICCWMIMVHCRIKLDEFWVKIANFVPQTRRKSLLAKYFANSEILQTAAQILSLLAQLSGMANMLLACWSILGLVVHSRAFLSSFYNFVTPKQHLNNAHNIKL